MKKVCKRERVLEILRAHRGVVLLTTNDFADLFGIDITSGKSGSTLLKLCDEGLAERVKHYDMSNGRPRYGYVATGRREA